MPFFISSLIQLAVMFGGNLTGDLIQEQGITLGMIRFAAGIENTNDLLADVEQALDQI